MSITASVNTWRGAALRSGYTTARSGSVVQPIAEWTPCNGEPYGSLTVEDLEADWRDGYPVRLVETFGRAIVGGKVARVSWVLTKEG